jgi:hypothetical protein
LAKLGRRERKGDDNAGDRNEDADEGEYLFLGPRGVGRVTLRTLRGVCLRWRDWCGMNRKDTSEKGGYKTEA